MTTEIRPVEGERYWRQLDLLNPEKLNEFNFIIVGAGSVGSWAAMVLAKMGAQRITVWDHDIIEPHNAPVQVYSATDVGKKKAEAIVSWVGRLADVSIHSVPFEIDEETKLVFPDNTIVIMAVHSMRSRQIIWRKCKNPSVKLVIDPRMGGEFLSLYAVNPINPQHEKFYEARLHSDEEAEALPCTARAIVYTSAFAAAYVASTVSSFVRNGVVKNMVGFHCLNLRQVTSEV